MASENLVVNPRLVVKTFERGGCVELAKVPVAFVILCKQQQMVGLILFPTGLIFPAALSHVSLHPNNRLHAFLDAFEVELHRAKHHPVVGYGKRGHSKFFRARDHLWNAVGSVQKGVLGVVMDVDKRLTHKVGGQYIVTESAPGMPRGFTEFPPDFTADLQPKTASNK
jgi:hypothetical protein